MSEAKPNVVALTDALIQEALDPKLSLNEAVNLLMDATNNVGRGKKVAILDGSAYGVDGVCGVSKGPSAKGSGYIDVELPNKMTIPIPANLLLPV